MDRRKATEARRAVFAVLLLIVLLPAFAWLVAPDKYSYGFTYSVDSKNVFVEKKPANCDWGHSPLGGKSCHYKKIVTPQKNDQGKVTSVYVTWERIED
ncbi:MAG: hypothetical protein WAM04_01330 [Candidatus Sulfotelmatobacter sp.]|jgi:hypothetical protein